MNNVLIVYWSGTGNTKLMAEAIERGVVSSGTESILRSVDAITWEEAANYERIALGCPSMGMEVLEEMEFEPFFAKLSAVLANKKIVLFGSYGWGGSYMQEWESRVKQAEGELIVTSILALGEPDLATVDVCIAAGKALAES